MFVEVPVLRLVGAEQYECRPAGGQSCSDTVLSNWAKWVHPNVSHTVPNPDIRKVWENAVSGAVPPSNNLFSWSTVKPFKSHGSSTSPALNFTILLLICFSRAPWTLWKCCPCYFVRLSWSTKTEIISDLVYSFCTFTDSIGKIFACVTHNLILKGLCVAPMTCPLFLVRQLCVVSGPYRCLNALHLGDILYCCSVTHAAWMFLTTHQVWTHEQRPSLQNWCTWLLNMFMFNEPCH